MKFTNNGYQMEGHLVIRPAGPHPNPRHWAEIRTNARAREGFECATCPRSENYGFTLECHHRHYDNWGNETLRDVVMMCVPCHDLHTSAVRNARYANNRLDPPTYIVRTREVFVPRSNQSVEIEEHDEPTQIFVPRSSKYGF